MLQQPRDAHRRRGHRRRRGTTLARRHRLTLARRHRPTLSRHFVEPAQRRREASRPLSKCRESTREAGNSTVTTPIW
eukprot:2671418-Pleurochrysis_carterae.AAC.1